MLWSRAARLHTLATAVGSEQNCTGEGTDLLSWRLGGRFGEADDPVEPVVVGDGQGGQTEPGRLLHQLLRVRRPVQEAEVRVAVELGVGDGGCAAADGRPGTR